MTDIIGSSYRSDHSVIKIHIVISKFKIGKGIWKFILDYLDLVNKIIQEEKSNFALPVYSTEYVKKPIKFSINDDNFFEIILL